MVGGGRLWANSKSLFNPRSGDRGVLPAAVAAEAKFNTGVVWTDNELQGKPVAALVLCVRA